MPETRTITQTVYTFDELSDTAKDRVREQLNDYDDITGTIEMIIDPNHQEYPDWVLPTYHDGAFRLRGARRDIDHYASWEYCQEHLSIGYVIDLPAFMRAHKIAGKYRATYNAATEGYVTAQVTRGSKWTSYFRERYDALELDSDYWDNAERYADQLDQLRDLLESDMQNRIDQLSKQLRAEMEHQASDEYLSETCDANDYRFDERGNLV